MNRLSSHRIVRDCSQYLCKGFRRLSGVNPVVEGALLRTAHRRRQPMAEVVRRRTRTAAEAGPSTGLAGTMRPRSRARGTRTRGSAGDGTGPGGPELPASPVGPAERAGDGGSLPTHGVLSAKQSRAVLGPRPASAGPAQGRGRPRAGALGGTHGPDPGQPEPLRGTPAHGACRGLRRAPLRPRRLGPGRHPPTGPDVTCSTDNDNAYWASVLVRYSVPVQYRSSTIDGRPPNPGVRRSRIVEDER